MMQNKLQRVKKQEVEKTIVFIVCQQFLPDNIRRYGLMVDCGATSHIITEKNKFTRFGESFDPKKHYIELADGS